MGKPSDATSSMINASKSSGGGAVGSKLVAMLQPPGKSANEPPPTVVKKAIDYLVQMKHSTSCKGACAAPGCQRCWSILTHASTCVQPMCMYPGCITTKKLSKFLPAPIVSEDTKDELLQSPTPSHQHWIQHGSEQRLDM